MEPWPVGDGSSVKAYLEYDFLGAYDRNSLRMRQFYAPFKHLLLGQTWSSFGDPDAWRDTLDSAGRPDIAVQAPAGCDRHTSTPVYPDVDRLIRRQFSSPGRRSSSR